MVIEQEEWRTVNFTASKGDISVNIELTINMRTKAYGMCSPGQEMVKLESKNIEELNLNMQALKAAHNYLKLWIF